MTLTIEAGVRIEFQAPNDDQGGGVQNSRPELLVEGSLLSEGTAVEPIVLSSNAPVPAVGDWGGIRHSGGLDVSLEYVTIKYAMLGLRYEAISGVIATVAVQNSVIREVVEEGLYVSATGGAALTVQITGNEVTDTGREGVRFEQHYGCDGQW